MRQLNENEKELFVEGYLAAAPVWYKESDLAVSFSKPWEMGIADYADFGGSTPYEMGKRYCEQENWEAIGTYIGMQYQIGRE